MYIYILYRATRRHNNSIIVIFSTVIMARRGPGLKDIAQVVPRHVVQGPARLLLVI